jgi:hypothetical protein
MTNKSAMYEAVGAGIKALPADEAAKIDALDHPAIMIDTDALIVVTRESLGQDDSFCYLKKNHIVVIYHGVEHTERPFITQISRHEIKILRGEIKRSYRDLVSKRWRDFNVDTDGRPRCGIVELKLKNKFEEIVSGPPSENVIATRCGRIR